MPSHEKRLQLMKSDYNTMVPMKNDYGDKNMIKGQDSMNSEECYRQWLDNMMDRLSLLECTASRGKHSVTFTTIATADRHSDDLRTSYSIAQSSPTMRLAVKKLNSLEEFKRSKKEQWLLTVVRELNHDQM